MNFDDMEFLVEMMGESIVEKIKIEQEKQKQEIIRELIIALEKIIDKN